MGTVTIPRPTARAPQIIDIRAGSAGVEDTYPLELVEGSTPPHDISLDVVELSLGTSEAPGTWLTPTVDVASADACGEAAGVLNVRTVQLRVGGSYVPAANAYYLWSRIYDGGEVIVRQHFPVTVLA